MKTTALILAALVLGIPLVSLAPPAQAVRLYCFGGDPGCPGDICFWDPVTRQYDLCVILCHPCPYPGIAPARQEVLP